MCLCMCVCMYDPHILTTIAPCLHHAGSFSYSKLGHVAEIRLPGENMFPEMPSEASSCSEQIFKQLVFGLLSVFSVKSLSKQYCSLQETECRAL